MKRGETRSNWTSGHWVWLAAKVNQEYQVYLVYHEVTREYWVNKVSIISCTGEPSARMRGYPSIQDQEGSNLGISDPQNLSLPLVIAPHPPPETPTCCRNSWRRLTEADLPHQISEAGCGRGGSKTSYSLKMGPWYCAGLLCSAAYCVTGPLLCWNFSSTVSPGGVERRCCFWGEFNWVKRAPRLTLTFHYNGTPHHHPFRWLNPLLFFSASLTWRPVEEETPTPSPLMSDDPYKWPLPQTSPPPHPSQATPDLPPSGN